MLLLASNILNHAINGADRTTLLQELQERNLTPLIRGVRLRFFEEILLGAERVGDMEAAIASWTESTTREPFSRGDVFSFPDHFLFLTFEENEAPAPLIRAGIVYDAGTPEPFRKLDTFCRDVRELLQRRDQSAENTSETAAEFPQWEAENQTMPQGFRRFVAKQDADSLYTNLRKETTSRRILAASKLEDAGARVFLRTAQSAHLEGYAAKLLTGDNAPANLHIERLEDVGLVEREVQISCRKTGHALFRLPNAHALAVVTVSDATCSECGAPVADEIVQEVLAPTQLAASLLEDGSWLVSRLHFLLREMGVPEREIALGPSEGTGYGQMMANICGESFLLVTRDGDLTPAFARWAIDSEIETEASHLVIVATGRIHKEAGVLLQNHARRRIGGGQDFELILADDAATAGKELQGALDRVSQRVIAERLCVLDNTIGLSVSQLVLTRFRLQRSGEASEIQHPVVEDPQTFLPAAAPLTLAAHVSMGTGEMLDLDVQADQTSYINEAPQSEEPAVPWTPGTQGPWD